MRGIRTLFLAVIIALGAIVSSAQITVFVRSAADGGNKANNGLTAATAKLTIGGANGALAVAGITTLDIGAGNFDGATVTMPLVVNGANAGLAMPWAQETVLNTPITLNVGDADVVFDGVTFGAGSTINGASAGANVIVSNCKFSSANHLNTTGLGWEELSISGSRFDGDEGGGPTVNAITANGLTTFFLAETVVRDYTGTAVTISGAIDNAVLTYNELIAVNTAGNTNNAAIKLDVTSLSAAGAARIANCIISDATTTNGLAVSGSLAGKTVTIENNLISSAIAGTVISNSGTGMLVASCNSYGNAPSISTLIAKFSGAVQAGPFINSDVDDNGAGIGFVPNGLCNTNGPVTISGSTNSYFRIQDGVSAVASGGTVTAGLFTFNENVTVNKSLSIVSTDVSNYTRAGAWTTLNGTINVSIAAVNFTLNGIKVCNSTATQLVTSSATGTTTISNCWLEVNPTAGLVAVPTNGAIHILKNGDLSINGTRVSRPTSGTAPFIRALTFGAGNACRNVSIGGTSANEFQGTLQFSGLSLLSNVSINNSLISNAGIDGISFTGNTVNTASVTNCDIIDSRENGIGIRDRVTVGSGSTATFTNNEITGSGRAGSGYAGISISSTSLGTQSFTGNILAAQAGTNKPFINNRSAYSPVATCNWWGSKSQDVIEANNTGGVILDNGTSGWYNDNTNSGSNGANFSGGAACTVRAFTITLAPSNATCFGSSTGSINNTLAGTTAGAVYTWSNGATTEDVSNLAAGTYSVTVTTASENTRSKSATILEPTQLSGNTAKTNITCFSLTNGTITVSNPAGGVINGITPTYNYRIDRAGGAAGDVGPQGSASFTGLGAGTYDVYIIAVGASPTCERVIGTQVIVEPTQINGSGSVTSNYNGAQISCPTSTDGVIAIAATGGTGALQYKLNGGSYQVSSTFSGLGAGTYTPMVRDANSCERTLAAVVITAPVQISGSGSVTSNYNGAQISCPTSTDGSIAITATGGTGALQYKLNGGSYQGSATFTGLGAGTYTPMVRDANGCEQTLSNVVITAPTPITGSGAVTSNYNGAQISCPTST
ncbi:MAG: beta strand repeat-containing protein, partial [Bacteroidota bacterium]